MPIRPATNQVSHPQDVDKELAIARDRFQEYGCADDRTEWEQGSYTAGGNGGIAAATGFSYTAAVRDFAEICDA